MKTNVPIRNAPVTHEGAPARILTPEMQLRRSVMACMLWEDTFYESGESIADRIRATIPHVDPPIVAKIAVEAREKMKLRHMPLLIVREMARLPKHRAFVADTLSRIIQRADELAEFVAIYWKEARQPLSAQVKKGLANAFQKFNAYQLAKYNRDGAVKLRDVLFLCHAKPKDEAQAQDWKQLVDGTLPIPGTWENRLSDGEDKKTVWESMLKENTLGGLALLRNLRNMSEAKVDENLIFDALEAVNTERILPFRFIAAARYAPQWESKIEKVMFKCIQGRQLMQGKTILLVDVSGSMADAIGGKSDLRRIDAASGLAMLAREMCEQVSIYTFSTSITRVPDRHGFALRDAIGTPRGGTYLGNAVEEINNAEEYDRLIIITDEQSSQAVPNPKATGYVINVAAYKNGIGYGPWIHIDGWSEAVFDYIQEIQNGWEIP
jgi:hypothetical protein